MSFVGLVGVVGLVGLGPLGSGPLAWAKKQVSKAAAPPSAPAPAPPPAPVVADDDPGDTDSMAAALRGNSQGIRTKKNIDRPVGFTDAKGQVVGAAKTKPASKAPRDPAKSDDVQLPWDSANANAGKPGLRMRYHGVAPGRDELPPHPPSLPLVKGPQRLTWPGFQIHDGTPTVFLQLSGPVEYSVSDKPGQVMLTLQDTVVTLTNNLRPLRVEAFKTAVQRIKVGRKKNTVTVVVDVKGQVAHKERLAQAENGYSMLVMEVLPMSAGDSPPKPASGVSAPDPALPSTAGAPAGWEKDVATPPAKQEPATAKP